MLDSDGLYKLAAADREVVITLQQAVLGGASVRVTWPTLAETLQGPAVSRVKYALSRLAVEPVEEQDWRDAGQLMHDSGMGGHTIDAALATVARRLPPPVLILTSDPDDLSRLTAQTPGIAVERV